nr:uncharacterized protein LOC128684321 [Cherax quadricarinatus]
MMLSTLRRVPLRNLLLVWVTVTLAASLVSPDLKSTAPRIGISGGLKRQDSTNNSSISNTTTFLARLNTGLLVHAENASRSNLVERMLANVSSSQHHGFVMEQKEVNVLQEEQGNLTVSQEQENRVTVSQEQYAGVSVSQKHNDELNVSEKDQDGVSVSLEQQDSENVEEDEDAMMSSGEVYNQVTEMTSRGSSLNVIETVNNDTIDVDREAVDSSMQESSEFGLQHSTVRIVTGKRNSNAKNQEPDSSVLLGDNMTDKVIEKPPLNSERQEYSYEATTNDQSEHQSVSGFSKSLEKNMSNSSSPEVMANNTNKLEEEMQERESCSPEECGVNRSSDQVVHSPGESNRLLYREALVDRPTTDVSILMPPADAYFYLSSSTLQDLWNNHINAMETLPLEIVETSASDLVEYYLLPPDPRFVVPLMTSSSSAPRKLEFPTTPTQVPPLRVPDLPSYAQIPPLFVQRPTLNFQEPSLSVEVPPALSVEVPPSSVQVPPLTIQHPPLSIQDPPQSFLVPPPRIQLPPLNDRFPQKTVPSLTIAPPVLPLTVPSNNVTQVLFRPPLRSAPVSVLRGFPNFVYPTLPGVSLDSRPLPPTVPSGLRKAQPHSPVHSKTQYNLQPHQISSSEMSPQTEFPYTISLSNLPPGNINGEFPVHFMVKNTGSGSTPQVFGPLPDLMIHSHDGNQNSFAHNTGGHVRFPGQNFPFLTQSFDTSNSINAALSRPPRVLTHHSEREEPTTGQTVLQEAEDKQMVIRLIPMPTSDPPSGGSVQGYLDNQGYTDVLLKNGPMIRIRLKEASDTALQTRPPQETATQGYPSQTLTIQSQPPENQPPQSFFHQNQSSEPLPPPTSSPPQEKRPSQHVIEMSVIPGSNGIMLPVDLHPADERFNLLGSTGAPGRGVGSSSYAGTGGEGVGIGSSSYAAIGEVEGSSSYAAVGGEGGNRGSSSYTTVGGAGGNRGSSSYAAVGGAEGNRGSSSYATVGGAGGDIGSSSYAAVGGAGGGIGSSSYGAVSGAGGGIRSSYGTVGGTGGGIGSSSYGAVGGAGWGIASSSYAGTGGAGSVGSSSHTGTSESIGSSSYATGGAKGSVLNKGGAGGMSYSSYGGTRAKGGKGGKGSLFSKGGLGSLANIFNKGSFGGIKDLGNLQNLFNKGGISGLGGQFMKGIGNIAGKLTSSINAVNNKLQTLMNPMQTNFKSSYSSAVNFLQMFFGNILPTDYYEKILTVLAIIAFLAFITVRISFMFNSLAQSSVTFGLLGKTEEILAKLKENEQFQIAYELFSNVQESIERWTEAQFAVPDVTLSDTSLGGSMSHLFGFGETKQDSIPLQSTFLRKTLYMVDKESQPGASLNNSRQSSTSWASTSETTSISSSTFLPTVSNISWISPTVSNNFTTRSPSTSWFSPTFSNTQIKAPPSSLWLSPSSNSFRTPASHTSSASRLPGTQDEDPNTDGFLLEDVEELARLGASLVDLTLKYGGRHWPPTGASCLQRHLCHLNTYSDSRGGLTAFFFPLVSTGVSWMVGAPDDTFSLLDTFRPLWLLIEPLNNPQLSEPLNNLQLSEPLNNPQLIEPLNNPQLNEPLNNLQLSEPLNNPQLIEPLNNPQLIEPLNNPQLIEPLNNPQLSEPLNNPQLSEPLNKPQLSEPLNNPQLSEPLNNLQLSEPLNNPQLSEPLNNLQLSEPLNNPQLIEPLNNPQLIELLNNPQLIEPLNNPQLSEPLNNPQLFEPEPLNNPQLIEPLNNSQLIEPLNNPQLIEPLNNPQLSEPLNNPQLTEPLNNPQLIEPLNNPQLIEPLNNPQLIEALNNPQLSEPLISQESNEPFIYSEPSEPFICLEPSEPSSYSDPSEPFICLEPSEPSIYWEPSEPFICLEPSEPSTYLEPNEPLIHPQSIEPLICHDYYNYFNQGESINTRVVQSLRSGWFSGSFQRRGGSVQFLGSRAPDQYQSQAHF